MHKKKEFNRESGNAVVIVLVILVIAVVGVLAYLSGKATSDKSGAAENAAVESTQQADVPQIEIKPGNPVVAKVDGKEITRADVFGFIQTLPTETRQLPIGQLFPVALDQVINGRVVNEKTDGVNLDRDPIVKERLDAVKKNIVRDVYVQKKVDEMVTEDRLKEAYDQYVKAFPEIQEVQARHILVKDKSLAKDLIKQLDEGADFETLAKENSTDSTAENGGLIGYFAENEVVPPFAEAAFALGVNEYTKKPVETEFGYHIIQVLEKRQRPPADFEQAKPFLEAQLRQVALGQLIQSWRDGASVERFDINGDPIKPAEEKK